MVRWLGGRVVLGCAALADAAEALGAALLAHLRLVHGLAAGEGGSAWSAELLLYLDALEVLLILKLLLHVLVSLEKSILIRN